MDKKKIGRKPHSEKHKKIGFYLPEKWEDTLREEAMEKTGGNISFLVNRIFDGYFDE